MRSCEVELLAKRIGVTRLANLTGLDVVGMPVVAAIRPLSRNLTVSFGKGKTLEEARRSALFEAAELYFSEAPLLPIVTSTYASFGHGLAVNPVQFEYGRKGADIAATEFQWVQGEDLRSGRPIMVPWDIIAMDLSAASHQKDRVLDFGATGLAAGFDRDRTIAHALYEVIERDSHQRWNEADDAQREDTLVDLGSIQQDDTAALLRSLAEAGFRVLIWDMTAQCGVPCYLAEIIDPRPQAVTSYVQGAAADIVPERAIFRALSEAIQVRLTYIGGSRDDLAYSDYGARYNEMVENRVWILQHLLARRMVSPVIHSWDSERGVVDEICRRLFSIHEQSPIVVNLTPDDEMAVVVKAIIPTFRDVPDAIDRAFDQSHHGSGYAVLSS